MSYHNSPKQSSSSQGSASEQYIKIVEQLIDSDDDQTIMKRMIELQAVFPVLKKMMTNLTNQEKVTLFLRDHIFKVKLTQKLRDANRLLYHPMIKVSLYTIRHRCQIVQQFNQQDLQHIFSKFGNLETLMVDKNLAYFRYDNYISCYTAIKTLNQFQVSDTLRLAISWCDSHDIQVIEQYHAARCPNDTASVSVELQQVKKRMARYDIFLEINTEFELSKKIIGPKGVNMKKILSQALEKNKQSLQTKQSIAKLRLRGKGSGFYEGWNHSESQDVLNLCVTSKNNEVFKTICQECQKLLFKLAWDYKQYYFKIHKKQCQGIAYQKFQLKKSNYELTKQLHLQQVNNTLDFIDSAASCSKKIKQKEIIKLIALRDKVRKQGKYSQADEIREHLSKQGVMLVDQKHASGKELKTTWKYV